MHLATLVPALLLGLIGGLLAALFARLNTFVCKRRTLLLAKIDNRLLQRLVRILETILIVASFSIRLFALIIVLLVFSFLFCFVHLLRELYRLFTRPHRYIILLVISISTFILTSFNPSHTWVQWPNLTKTRCLFATQISIIMDPYLSPKVKGKGCRAPPGGVG